MVMQAGLVQPEGDDPGGAGSPDVLGGTMPLVVLCDPSGTPGLPVPGADGGG